MPRDVKKFLIWIAIASIVVGFAAGDRRDPFSLTASVTAFALLFTTTMALGSHFASKQPGHGGGGEALVRAAGAAYLDLIGMAFMAGKSGQDGSSAPWLARIAIDPEVGPGLRAAAVNACHYAFEIGKSVREGRIPHDQALKMSAAESARQFTFAAHNHKPLPPLRHDSSASLPPTMAGQRPADQPIYREVERRTNRLADELQNLPGMRLINNTQMGPFLAQRALLLIVGLVALRRATSPSYFFLEEWKHLTYAAEMSICRSSLAAHENRNAGKPQDPEVAARIAANSKEQVQKLHSRMLICALRGNFANRRNDMANTVQSMFLESLGFKEGDAEISSEIHQLLSRTTADVMAESDS